MPKDHVSFDTAAVWYITNMMNNAQHWDHLSFHFLTPDIVEETSSLRKDHDIHFEGLSKSDDLQIVPIDACFGHCLHVLFISGVNLLGSRSSSDGRICERAMVLAFWVSTGATSGMDDKE